MFLAVYLECSVEPMSSPFAADKQEPQISVWSTVFCYMYAMRNNMVVVPLSSATCLGMAASTGHFVLHMSAFW